MSKLDRSEESMMSSSNVNIDTESKSQNDDDVVRECPLNGGLKKSKGNRKKSTSLRLKFARKRNDASNPKDLVGLGMYVDFDFNNKKYHSYHILIPQENDSKINSKLDNDENSNT